MAMTLTDVVKELELQTEYLDLTNDNLATFTKSLAVEKQQEQLDAKERKSESGSYQKDVLTLLTEIRDNGLGGGGAGGGGAGGGAGFGSSFGSAFGENAGAGIGAGVGLAAVGAGIAGFMTALAVADPVIEKYGGDFSGYKNAIVGLGEIFSEMDSKGMLGVGGLLAAGAALGMTAGFTGSARAAGGMFFLGAGIGAFFTGLALNDAAIQKIGSDGSGLLPIITNAMAGIEVIAGSDAWKPLAGILAIGALFGQAPSVAGKATVGLGLIGAGIGAFFAGIALGSKGIEALGTDGSGLKNLMVNFGEGLSALANGMRGDFANLAGFGLLASQVAAGLTVLTAGELVNNIMNFASSFFTTDDDKSTIQKIADDLKALNDVDMDVSNLDAMSIALGRLGDSIGNVADLDLDNFKSNLTELASAMQVLNPLLLAMYNGGDYKDDSGWWDKEYKFNPGLKDVPIPEIASSFRAIGQITSTPIPTPEQLESAANSARVLQEATGDSTRAQTTDQIMENTEPSGGVNIITVDNSTNTNAPSNTSITQSGGKGSPPPPVTDE